MRSLSTGTLGVIVVLTGVTAVSASSLTMTSGLSVNRNTPFNLINNGSFEDGPGAPDSSAPFKFWATGTSSAPFAVPAGWSSSGGPDNYAMWSYDTVGPYTFGSAQLPHGNRGLYFGNQFCSAISQMPTFNGTTGLVTFPNPATLTITPKGPGYAPAVQLSQTVTGLNTSAIYKFSFWTSGEGARNASFQHDGIFGLDVTGFSRVYLQAPAGAGPDTVGASHLYEFYLQPAASNTTFTWTNWGHYGSVNTSGWSSSIISTDELVLDDVVLNFDRLVPEPASLALLGIGGVALLRRRAISTVH